MDSVIGENHPMDGRHWDCQCARCGSSMMSESCGRCGGEGTTAVGELYEEDPLWYDVDDVAPCHECNGEGAWMLCISSPEYCEAHPMKGREATPRHTPEWFALPEAKCPNKDSATPKS